MRPLFLSILLLALGSISKVHATTKSFGVFYPHTRWVALGNPHLQVDAYKDRLILTENGRSTVVKGCWQGRGFYKDGHADYFSVAREGVDAFFEPPSTWQKYQFKRVKPDPKT